MAIVREMKCKNRGMKRSGSDLKRFGTDQAKHLRPAQ